jgi:hypothetical protein
LDTLFRDFTNAPAYLFDCWLWQSSVRVLLPPPLSSSGQFTPL